MHSMLDVAITSSGIMSPIKNSHHLSNDHVMAIVAPFTSRSILMLHVSNEVSVE
jgi:hypothetical protein